MSKRWEIHRRTFLRGVGAAVALPLLDAMVPSLARVANAAEATASALPQAPKRMAFVYVPNGATMSHWKPSAVGTDFAFPRILKPLERFRKDLCVISGLGQTNGYALGDGAGDHARASASFLTGAHC